MKNPRVSRRKEIFKIRAEINAKETKETIANINNLRYADDSVLMAESEEENGQCGRNGQILRKVQLSKT